MSSLQLPIDYVSNKEFEHPLYLGKKPRPALPTKWDGYDLDLDQQSKQQRLNAWKTLGYSEAFDEGWLTGYEWWMNREELLREIKTVGETMGPCPDSRAVPRGKGTMIFINFVDAGVMSFRRAAMAPSVVAALDDLQKRRQDWRADKLKACTPNFEAILTGMGHTYGTPLPAHLIPAYYAAVDQARRELEAAHVAAPYPVDPLLEQFDVDLHTYGYLFGRREWARQTSILDLEKAAQSLLGARGQRGEVA